MYGNRTIKDLRSNGPIGAQLNGNYCCPVKLLGGLSMLVKIDLNLLFVRIIGCYRSFLIKISAFYNAYSLKPKSKPLDE